MGGLEQRVAAGRLADGTEVAYACTGDGPVLVYVSGWLTHLELSWALPPERRFYEALSQGRTLVRYDKPGCGLSGRSARSPSMALELEALEAVVRAVGAERFDLLGTSLGAAVAVRWAEARPQIVDRLILYGGWLRGTDLASPALRAHISGLVSTHWGLGSDVLADIFAPEATPSARAAFAGYQREASSPGRTAAMLELSYQSDVSDVASHVTAPTLVLHRKGDRAAPIAQGRLLAAAIPSARLEVLPGRSHLPYIGDGESVVSAVRQFLGLPPLAVTPGARLTPRQHQVAGLVAEGLANREIADLLGISERSAEGHVERIRLRLGFRSRTQIAAWVVATGKPD